MVKVYAMALAVGLAGLVLVIIGSGIASGRGRESLDPNRRLGSTGRMVLAGLLGFGMGGMAAEFSPLGIDWPAALLLAVVASAASALWARRASTPAG